MRGVDTVRITKYFRIIVVSVSGCEGMKMLSVPKTKHKTNCWATSFINLSQQAGSHSSFTLLMTVMMKITKLHLIKKGLLRLMKVAFRSGGGIRFGSARDSTL